MRKSLVLAVTAVISMVFGNLVVTPSFAEVPTCTVTITDSNITYNGTNNSDVICIEGNNNIVNALGGDDTIIDNGDGNTINLGDGNDSFDGSNGDGATIDGGAGDDDIIGTPGIDEINGDEGDDTLIGGASNDVIDGGDGSDNLAGAAGDDTISGDAGIDSIEGGDGADTLNGGDGDDTLVGGVGNDTLNGGIGADFLEGNAGNDSLFGQSGIDNLQGNDGDDVMSGGSEIDSLDGGAGLNYCDFTSGETVAATCQYDQNPPQLANLSFDSSSLDVSNGNVTVNATIHITDEVGVWHVGLFCAGSRTTVELSDISDPWNSSFRYRSQELATVITGQATKSGSLNDLTLTFPVVFQRGTLPGSFSCSYDSDDVLGNHRSSTLTSTQIVITRDPGNWDDVAPAATVNSVSANSLEVGSSTASTHVSLHFGDQTQISHVGLFCGNASTILERVSDSSSLGYHYRYRESANGYATSQVASWNGSDTNLVVTLPLTFSKGSNPGTYACSYDSDDSLGHHRPHTLLGFNIALTRSTGVWDSTPPSFASVALSKNFLEVGSRDDQLEVTVHFKDATQVWHFGVFCGPGRATAMFQLDPTRTRYTYIHKQEQPGILNYEEGEAAWVGSSTDATVTFPIVFPAGSIPGEYHCQIDADDNVGNHLPFFDSGQVVRVYRTPAGQPASPKSLGFIADKPTTGLLSWSSPDALGSPALYGYAGQYSEDGTHWKDLPGGATSLTSLSVSGLKADRDYWFRVRGENGGTVGQDTNFMNLNWVTIKIRTPAPAVPDKPSGLVVSGVTSTGFTFDWTSSVYNGGAAINNFTVETSRDGGTTWVDVKKATNTSVRLSVTGAAPGTNYLVRVAAVNSVGHSDYLTGSVTTVNVGPYAPQNLRFANLGATSLTLQWDLPSSNGGSGISDYKVEVSGNGGTSWTVLPHAASNNLAFDVSNLLKNRAYRFRVSAINSIGTGPASTVLTVTTTSTVAGAPTGLTKGSISSSGVVLGWTAPTDFGGLAITDYRTEVSRDGGNAWIEVPHTASANRSISLSGLAPGTQYLVRVSARNSVGYSEFLTGEFTTLLAVATAPLNLTWSNVSATGLALGWSLPSSNGGSAISDYKVEVSSNCSAYTAIAHAASNALSFNVTGLKAGTKYCFRVSTKNAIGVSKPSSVVQVTTLGNAPSAPTSLAVKASKTSVALTWKAATVSGGSAVRNYVVEYSKDGGKTWITIKKAVSTSTSLTVTGLKSKTSYSFRVKAVNDVGPSTVSKVLSVKTS